MTTFLFSKRNMHLTSWVPILPACTFCGTYMYIVILRKQKPKGVWDEINQHLQDFRHGGSNCPQSHLKSCRCPCWYVCLRMGFKLLHQLISSPLSNIKTIPLLIPVKNNVWLCWSVNNRDFMSNFIRISFICDKAGTRILDHIGRREIKFVKKRGIHTNMLTF